MTVRLLLINPKFAESFWSFKWAIERILSGKRALNPPLGLATVAALCPADWQITIVDENIEAVPLVPRVDIVGVGGMGVQFRRQRELLAYYRSQGYFTVAGGSYASLCPEKYQSLADSVIAGEAEYIWPRFCADFERGKPAPGYRETGTVALADSPTPRFDLLQLEKYSCVSLQFSRGCPFLCEFCDIIVMFGRKPRWKSNEQVGRELDLLRARGVKNVFFVDDNLIGNKAAAKNLLRFLAGYQQRHDYRFRFGTEASLNLAQDPELLRLFPQANFAWLFIGIESADAETLRRTRKAQNAHEDVLTSLQRIYAHGIDVLAGFIIGFDDDDAGTFEQQYRFIVSSGIQVAMIGLLTALPHTPLYERLQREGRLTGDVDHADNTKPATNVMPRRMAYADMVNAYMALYRRLMSDKHIAERIGNKLRYLSHPVPTGEYTPWQQVLLPLKLLGKGILPGGPSRWFHFLRSVPWRNPAQWPLVVADWIVALAMRDYADRHFAPVATDERRIVDEVFAAIERKLRRYQREGRLALVLERGTVNVPELCIGLKGWLDRDCLARVQYCVLHALRHTRSRVTLNIGEFQQWQTPRLRRLLRRLAGHGDRIYLSIPASVRERIAIDWTRFNLVLERSAAGTGGA